MLLMLFTLLQALSLSISGYTFNALLMALEVSSTTVELLNNCLAALILDQLSQLAAAWVFKYFKSAYSPIANKPNFMMI